jgi:hypothetical protein
VRLTRPGPAEIRTNPLPESPEKGPLTPMDRLTDQATTDQPEARPSLTADHPATIDVEASERAAVAYFAQWYGVAPMEMEDTGPSLADDRWATQTFNAERPDGNGYCPDSDRDCHTLLTQSAFDAGFEAVSPADYRALGADGPEPGRAD